MVGDANVKTGRDNLITGLEARVGAVGHHTTKIDTSDARKTANDLAGAGRGQCILVIDTRIGHPDGDGALIKLAFIHLDKAVPHLAITVFDQ